jgi:hypothetical protein
MKKAARDSASGAALSFDRMINAAFLIKLHFMRITY